MALYVKFKTDKIFFVAYEGECELETKDDQECPDESSPLQNSQKSQWRDLIPVIKVEISSVSWAKYYNNDFFE